MSLQLSKLHELALLHVDSVQFLPGLKMRSFQESCKLIAEFESQGCWLIDGYGPLDLIEKRFAMADRVVFIDLPLWQHLWWYSKRVFKNFFFQRAELPEHCNEANCQHIKRLYLSLWRMHWKMRPELIKILSRESLNSKVVRIRSSKAWQELYRSGL